MLSIEGASGPIVLDIGSSTIRAGFSGASKPSLVANSVIGLNSGEVQFPLFYDKPLPHVEVKHIGISLQSSNHVDSISDETLSATLNAVLHSEHVGTRASDDMMLTEANPVLISEPSVQNNTYRQKVIQLLFEKMGARGAFVCKRSVLSAFSLGKTNAVVLSVGADVTNISCVAGGHSYPHLTGNWNMAGNAIDREMVTRLRSQSAAVSFLPKAFHSARDVHASFRTYSESQFVRRMKEDVCRVAENRDLRVHVENAAYELPDGTRIDCSRVSQSVPEILFSDKGRSLTSMMKEVIEKCRTSDENLAQTLLQSVVVCGGTSCMSGFTERVQNELSHQAFRNEADVKCFSGLSSADKQHSAWIGGSIVASLGNFNSLWITKREYEEHGVGIVGKKCP